MSKIQAFFKGDGTDHQGRTLNEVLELDDQWWDDCHDFIQWVFPLPMPSQFFKGDDCPLLSMEDISILSRETDIQSILSRSATRYCSFLGIELIDFRFLHSYDDPFEDIRVNDSGITCGSWRVAVADNFSEQAKYWLKANDHNHLRINRMLQCLVLFGEEELAKAIFKFLAMIKCEFPYCITDTTMVYWRNALTGYSY